MATEIDVKEPEAGKPEGGDFNDPLFDDEVALSEDDLRGMTEEAEEREEPEGEEQPLASGEEAEDSGQEDPAAAPPKESDTPPKPEADQPPAEEKPPAGYVKLEALHEERGRRRQMQQEIEDLRVQLQTLQQRKPEATPEAPADDAFADFKVLSDKEFADLAMDDPSEAIVYQQRLRAYERHQAEKQQVEDRRRQQEYTAQQTVREAVAEIQQMLPDLYEPDSATNKTLTEFANSNGFSEYLPILTDPRTVVVPPGGGDPILLGKGAAELIGFINRVHQGSNFEAQLEAERQKIRDEVTAELTEKFKTGGIPRSLDAAPSSSGSAPPRSPKGSVSEDEWMSLPEDERRQLLGGG